ncbi:hypothetical protein GCM10010193_25580 [Kitasatospora atroaurantiaca]
MNSASAAKITRTPNPAVSARASERHPLSAAWPAARQQGPHFRKFRLPGLPIPSLREVCSATTQSTADVWQREGTGFGPAYAAKLARR